MLTQLCLKRQANAAEDTNVPGQVLPLAETTNENAPATNGAEEKPRAPRQTRQRGPPEDGIPSKNKVMVANLPYDLSEEKVSQLRRVIYSSLLTLSI